MATQAKPSKPQPMPNMLSLDSEDLPEIKDWKVGETYEVTLKIKQISASKGVEYPMEAGDKENKDTVHGRFEVLEAKTGESEAPAMDMMETKKPDVKQVAGALKRKFGMA